MKTFLKWFIGIIIVFSLLIFAGYIVLSSLFSNEPVVPSHAYLSIRLSGTLSEYLPPDPISEALGESELDLKKIRDDLEKARIDKRVKGVVFEIGMLETGYAKLQELRFLIGEFRKSGKKVYAFLGPDVALTKDYYLATACDSIFMPPAANLFLTGIRSEVTFYKDFFKRFGVQAQFVHIGKYKNAPDSYTRNTMSPAQKEVLEDIISQFYSELVQAISEARHISETEADRLIQHQSGFSGQGALKAGLVDQLGFSEDVVALFKKKDDKIRKLSAEEYARVPASSLKIRNKSRIAVVNCVGIIAGGSDSNVPLLGRVMGSASTISNIKRAARSRSIKAIILRIDSPGGSASASQNIWHAIKEASRKKPIIASVSDYGASGGYFLSMAADTMIAAPNSLVGSIGIFAGKFSFKNLYDKLDLNSEAVQKGRHADLFSVLQPWDGEEERMMQALITDFYREFVQRVAESRGMTFEAVDHLARGRVWTGREAARNGLFDRTGYFYSALQAAKKMAHIDSSQSVRLVYYPRRRSMFREVLSNLQVLTSASGNAFARFSHFIEQIQNKPLALLPFQMKIY